MNTLWLTKKSLTNSSSREADRWDLELIPITGSSADKGNTLKLLKSIESKTKHISLITNYETTTTNYNEICLFDWDVIVIDEVHKLAGGGKPKPPQLWANTDKLLKRYPKAFRQFLSGTPYQNKPEDMFAYLSLSNPEKFVEPFGSHAAAIREFLYMFANRNFADKFNLNTDKLFDVLASNLIRRRKDEVGIQLPDKTYVQHDIELDPTSAIYQLHRRIYNDSMLELGNAKSAVSIGSVFGYLHYLRLILLAPGWMPYNYYPVDPITLERSETPVKDKLEFAGPYPKLQYAAELTMDLLDQDEPVVITSGQFSTPLKWLHQMLSILEPDNTRFVDLLDGNSSNRADEIERAFQQGETKVLLLNSQAGAEGFNFQKTNDWSGGSSHMIKLDEWYNPGVNEQVEDRLWRTGTREPVTIHRLFVEKSADVMVKEILDKKIELKDEIMESEKLRPTDWMDKLKEIFGE